MYPFCGYFLVLTNYRNSHCHIILTFLSLYFTSDIVWATATDDDLGAFQEACCASPTPAGFTIKWKYVSQSCCSRAWLLCMVTNLRVAVVEHAAHVLPVCTAVHVHLSTQQMPFLPGGLPMLTWPTANHLRKFSFFIFTGPILLQEYLKLDK